MSFQTPLTIKKAINQVHNRKYLLPAIQRELVWDAEQIEKLFDSIMRGYPIGSFLFWKVSKENIKEYQFYEFIREYHERDQRHNPKANIVGEEGIIAILDGQQRLTALYLGLKGTYSYKSPYRRWDDNKAFPKRKLYLNLLSESEDVDFKYDFKFLTSEESEKRDENIFWFEVGKILEFNSENPDELYDYLVDNKLSNNKFAGKCLFRLSDVLNKNPIINYYLEEDQELDKVLNIFIRVNSGGTPLSYSDLLLSIATAKWEGKDAREEIHGFVDEINNIGEGFSFDKDFVLKTCLVLSDIKDIAFKVDNFNVRNMKLIEENWNEIKKAIRLSVELAFSLGYNYQTLISNYTLIPIAYYIFKKSAPDSFVLSSNYKDDRYFIRKWFLRSLLKKVFGGQPDSVLRPVREIIRENNGSFPYNSILERLKETNKTLTFTKEQVESLLFFKYGQKYTFSVLSLFYPHFDYKNRFHQDHIFPKSFFTRKRLSKKGISPEKIEFYLENYNYIGNLQLLEGIPNEEKSSKDYKEWIEATYPDIESRKEYIKKHFIPNTRLDLDHFKEFFEKRNEMILNKLNSLLISE